MSARLQGLAAVYNAAQDTLWEVLGWRGAYYIPFLNV